MDDSFFEKQLKENTSNYCVAVEAARSQVEIHEYFQIDAIQGMGERACWKDLKTIGKVKTIIEKEGKQTTENRYYINSLSTDFETFKKAVRGHWGVESMHGHLDVTFREDNKHTLDRNAAQNLTIIRKMALPLLKEMPFAPAYKRASLRSRRFIISMDFPFYLGMIYELLFYH